ncbi:MAG: hypothetical protein V1898_01320 [Patescibacteria group bacterium]
MISQKKALLIRFPLTSIENHIDKFDKLFHNLYYLLLQEDGLHNSVSCEIIIIKNKINFYITTPETLAEPITNVVFGLFPEIEIDKMNNFLNIEKAPDRAIGYGMKLLQDEMYAIRTFQQSAPHDPLSSFLNILATVPATDALFYQIVFEPAHDEMNTENSGLFYGETKRSSEAVDQPKVNASMRFIYLFPQGRKDKALIKIEEIKKTFDVYSTEKNKIVFKEAQNIQTFIKDFFDRKLNRDVVLTREELTSLFHIPDPALRMPAIDWILSKRAQPPFNLPTPYNSEPGEASYFATTNFRGSNILFGIKREDRRRHLYIIGKSGVGKSKLLEGLILDDIRDGKGVCVMDPHGDLIQNIIKFIPEERVKDTIYFNVPELDWPVAFNPLEGISLDMKQQMTQGFIEVFKKFFGADWSPKIEHVFRFTVLALLDCEKSTVVGMMKMLTNRKYRQTIIPQIQDSVVKHFWANEFSSWSEKFDNEAILPLVNKLGQFLSNNIIRNIVAQPENTIDFNDVLNNEKVLLIEMSKGKLGEENSNLLGAMLITKIYQTAMERAKIPEAERKEFYLYIDEFQNFATETFENILSESRKYKLNLTLSHQYLAQVPAAIKGTVFGNVGSMISFRVGADDGTYLSNEYHPIFAVDDFINLGVREILVKMSVEGATTPPFSARTKDVPFIPEKDMSQAVIDYSHEHYAKKRKVVDAMVAELYNASEDTNPVAGQEEEFEQPIV